MIKNIRQLIKEQNKLIQEMTDCPANNYSMRMTALTNYSQYYKYRIEISNSLSVNLESIPTVDEIGNKLRNQLIQLEKKHLIIERLAQRDHFKKILESESGKKKFGQQEPLTAQVQLASNPTNCVQTEKSSLLRPCQSCGHQFSKRANKCPKCDFIPTQTCHICSQEIAQNSKSCPECGDPEPFGPKIKHTSDSPKQKTLGISCDNSLQKEDKQDLNTSEKLRHTSSGDTGFWGKLINGDYGLAKTYWLYGVLVGFIVNLAMKPITSVGLLIFLTLTYTAYEIPVIIGTWRAANKYEGAKVWATLAKCAITLGAIILAISLLAIVGVATNS
jgi:hypothetical protein